ncbi:hypothetical protein PHYBOEH_011168 [Phytophthora boehmeriae]|uniref:Uncharacterized protein n=1 Tax=Phytophthora boehmeriae TaxID=109152 RepID=A0A8T1VLI1_9STRA|nr:hypothetical protein PHYBOEH_011168 [Phytophthora boehmeriae]
MSSQHDDDAQHKASAYDEHDEVTLTSRPSEQPVEDENDLMDILVDKAAEALAQTQSTVESAKLAAGYGMQVLGRPPDLEGEEETKLGMETAREFLPEDSVMTSRASNIGSAVEEPVVGTVAAPTGAATDNTPDFADYLSASRWSYDLDEYEADAQVFGQVFTKNVKNLYQILAGDVWCPGGT